MTDASDAAAPSMTIAVSGSTGLIGMALTHRLASQGHRIKPIVRDQPPSRGQAVYWDQQAGTLDAEALAGVDAVIHLAGESIIGRWTDAKRQRIRDSRVDGTALLARTLADLDAKPRVLVSASAAGYYGDRGDTVLEEDAGPGDAGEGFLRRVCEAWESAADPAREAGIRVVHPRIGMVLARDGGALPTMLPAFRFGLGGTIGSGDQWVPWIHLTDLVGILIDAVTDDRLDGPVNAVAPNPVTNRQLTRTLGRILGRPTIIPVPSFGAKLAFGELADELLLASQRIVPGRLQAIGFPFAFPDLEPALRNLLDRSDTTSAGAA